MAHLVQNVICYCVVTLSWKGLIIDAGEPIFKCDFESDTNCGWSTKATPESLWIGIEPTQPKYKYHDHTSGSLKGGHVLTLHLGRADSKDEGWSSASIYSDVIHSVSPKCLSFWYISRQIWGNQDRYFEIYTHPDDGTGSRALVAITIPYEHDDKSPWVSVSKTIKGVSSPGYKIEIRQYWFDEGGHTDFRNVTLFDDLVVSEEACDSETDDLACNDAGTVTCDNKRCISSFHRCNNIWNECGPGDSADEPDCTEPEDYTWVSAFPLGSVFVVFSLVFYRFYLRPRKREEEYPYVAHHGFRVLKARVHAGKRNKYKKTRSDSTEHIIQPSQTQPEDV